MKKNEKKHGKAFFKKNEFFDQKMIFLFFLDLD